MESLFERSPDIRRNWGILIGVPVLFFLAYLYPVIPGLSNIPLCGVRHFLGVDCPGCGLTSSFGALIHGGIRESIGFHPLGCVIAMWLLYNLGRSIHAIAIGRPPGRLISQRSMDLLVYVFLAAMLIQWAFKMVLTYLRPI